MGNLLPKWGRAAAALNSLNFPRSGSHCGEITTQYILRYIPEVEEKSNHKVFREIRRFPAC